MCLNFNRLTLYSPDYGYFKKVKELLRLDEDGLFELNLKNKKYTLEVTFNDLLEEAKILNERNRNANHAINHILISPDGEHVKFIHRYFLDSKQYDQLFVFNRKTKNLKLLHNKGFTSHFTWKDNQTLIGFLSIHQQAIKLYSIDIYSGIKSILSNSTKSVEEDGHPSLYKHHLIYDTYPDRSRLQHLFYHNLQSDQSVKCIASLFSPLKYFETNRCDLHPRWSPKGNFIFFDSTFNGKRHLYYMSTKDLL